MSGKRAVAHSSTASGPARGAIGDKWPNGLVAGAILLFAAGYLFLYLAADLPGHVTRAELLKYRLLLPELAAARWFGLQPSFTLLDRWPVLLAAAGIIAWGWLTGRLLLRVPRVISRIDDEPSAGQATAARLTPLEQFVFSCGVGLNALSLYVLAIGLAGALTRRWLIATGAAVLAISAWQAALRRAPRAAAVDDVVSDGVSASWLWLAAPFAAAIMLGGVLPPLDFDVREYHLQAPKEFFQRGSIGFLPHNVYGNMPLGAEMFSLLAMALLDDWRLGALVGKTVIAAFAPLTAAALVAAGRRFASPGAGIVAAVLYLSVPWVSVVSTSGLIEGVLAFYLSLSLYAALLWRQTQTPSNMADGQEVRTRPSVGDWRLILAGFCAGAAVSCKYPAVLFVALPLLAFIAWGANGRPWRSVAIFGLALLAGCGLWFAKNWWLTGNPVYPLLSDWLDGATRTADKNARWSQAHLPHDFSLWSLKESLTAVALDSAWLSPVMAPLAVLGFAARRHRRLAMTLGGYFAYIITAWWLFTHRIDRFWIPALPVLALLAGLGAVWSASLAWLRMALATLVVGLSISFIYVTAPETTYNAYFVSLPETRRDENRINAWYLTLNAHVPPGGAVLSVGDAQIFDLDVPVLYNTVFDDCLAAAICQDRGPQEIAAELRRRNISHVFVNWSEIARYRQPGNYGGVPDFITPDWFERLVREGVFDAPWRLPLLPNQEVYPVAATSP